MEKPIKKFFFDGMTGRITIFTFDIEGKRVDLYLLNDRDEATTVCRDLNAAVAELVGGE